MKSLAYVLLASSARGLQLPAVGAPALQTTRSPRRLVGAPAMQVRPPSWNPIENFKQMADQRVAKVSHCMLAAGTAMTLAEANAKIDKWKAEIGNDEEKFLEVARRESECPMSAEKGGLLGVFSRGKLSTELDQLIFQEDVVPVANGGTGGVVRGPIGTSFSKAGLSLIYVHTCWEPMSSGVVGALFDPPESLKNKFNNLMGGDKKD